VLRLVRRCLGGVGIDSVWGQEVLGGLARTLHSEDGREWFKGSLVETHLNVVKAHELSMELLDC